MNGILIIDKPKGYTSHDVINILRKELNTKKIGHTGTLDPNATGVLPILVGQATKISKYLIEHDKTYIAELKLGEKSLTGDTEGEIIQKKVVPNLTNKTVENVLKSFIGKQKQIPPIYSAVKINGKKAYEYARKNQNIELEPREIEIKKIELISFENDIVTYKVTCTKGTYIRALCQDIAEKLGTVGLMQNLCRTQVDNFNIENAVTLEEIRQKGLGAIEGKIISIENVFCKNKRITLKTRETQAFLNGVQLLNQNEDGVYRIYDETQFLGLGTIKNNLLKRDVIVIDNHTNNV